MHNQFSLKGQKADASEVVAKKANALFQNYFFLRFYLLSSEEYVFFSRSTFFPRYAQEQFESVVSMHRSTNILFTYTQLQLNKPYENEVTLRGQNIQ